MTLILFGIATFILTVSPGPGVLYVTARSLAQGRRAGFLSMLAIEAGEVVWIAAAATGVAALLATSVSALTFLRFAGAAYLLYLGLQRWRHSENIQATPRAELGKVFVQGFVTQLLNPKVALFFVAFLPQFLDTAHAFVPQVITLGAIYIAIAIAVDGCYVLTASALAQRFARSQSAKKTTGRVAAVTYAAMGLAAAATGVAR